MSLPQFSLIEGTRTHHGPPRVTALRNVTLEINQGEFVAIIGPSGSGKSTLLNILGLLDRPSTGHLTFCGTDTSTLSETELDELRAGELGFVFQDSIALGNLSAASNLDLPLRHRGFARQERERRVRLRLREVGLADKAEALSSELSGGQLQRVAIARALINDPSVILADEPTGNLDRRNADAVMELLRKVNLAGVTVVVITHDPTVASVADRVVTISDGTIISDTDPKHHQRSSLPSRAGTDKGPLRRRLGYEFLDSMNNLTAAPLRIVLMLATIALGVGGLIAAQGVSLSAAEQVSQHLTTQELDEVTVTGPVESIADGTLAEIRRLPPVIAAGLVWDLADSVSVSSLRPSIAGSSMNGVLRTLAGESLADIYDIETTPAHALSVLQHSAGTRTALIGVNAAERLGVSAVGPGHRLWVSGQPFEIVGMVDSSRDATIRSAVIISPEAARAVSAYPPQLQIRVEPGRAFAVSKTLPYLLDPSSTTAFAVSEVPDLRNIRRGVATDLDAAFALTSVVLLAMSTVGIAAIMTTSVLNRRREIGLRRAVGASRLSVARMFVADGAILGLAGGLTGAALGMLATISVTTAQGWTPVLAPTLPLVAAGCGVSVGIVATLVPAMRAAKVEPAIAIRATN